MCFTACPCCVAGTPLTVLDQMVAAVGASCVVSLVATPTELLKCRLQAQGNAESVIARFRAAGIDPATVSTAQHNRCAE